MVERKRSRRWPAGRGAGVRETLGWSAVVALFMSFASPVLAETYPLPPKDVDLIGHVQTVTAKNSDTLLDIGRRYGVGYNEMRAANPGVDMWLPKAGSKIVVPTRYILPPGPRRGIVLNLPEMRLYYYPPAKPGEPRVVETFPVSIGRMDWATPLGETRVIAKKKDPAWYPPESIREEAAKKGEEMPKVVPAGPDNPLGQHALRLGIPGYLIHGTNKPWGVGMRVSHGCVRMYPEDIAELFGEVPVNTPVRIINRPYKAGWYAGTLFIEAHRVLEEDKNKGLQGYLPAVEAVANSLGGQPEPVNYGELKAAAKRFLGYPVPISRFVGGSTATRVAATDRKDADRPGG